MLFVCFPCHVLLVVKVLLMFDAVFCLFAWHVAKQVNKEDD